VFRPKKVLATGGSKRGVAAAICGIHDDRFTAILPVVAPIMGNPGGAYVSGSALLEEAALNRAFLEHLPPQLPSTARQALEERDLRRLDQSITREQALAANWSEADMLRMNDEAWNACRITPQLDRLRRRGLEFFYHVGSNDNVSPALRQVGEQFPDFPLYILPGGQHGGPKGSGFTLQTPAQPEADENVLAFARQHFFNHRSLPAAPAILLRLDGNRLTTIVTFASGTTPQRNTLSWCLDRHPPYTFAAEYDHWETTPLIAEGESRFTAEFEVPAAARTIDVISTHAHEENGLSFHFSSPYCRQSR
jgi:hypothetical protein